MNAYTARCQTVPRTWSILKSTPVSCVVVVVVVVTLPPSFSTIADAAADAFAIARPRLLQYFAYNFVTQPAARQPNPIATRECAPCKIFSIIFRHHELQLWMRHDDEVKSSADHSERRASNSPTRRIGPQLTLNGTSSVAPYSGTRSACGFR